MAENMGISNCKCSFFKGRADRKCGEQCLQHYSFYKDRDGRKNGE